MKTTISTLLTSILITLTASAAPTLFVETSITQLNAKGVKEVLAAPSVAVESGKLATIQVAKLEYSITPTLLGNGTVDLRAVLTERNGEKKDQLASLRMNVGVGKVAEIKVGQMAITTKTSLAK